MREALNGHVIRIPLVEMSKTSRVDRLIRTRIRELARYLPASREGDEEGIHRARIATRRLRETLPVLLQRRPSRYRKIRARVRRLTCALGPVRELDVTMGLIAEWRGRDEIAPRALDLVRDAIAADRSDWHARLAARTDRTDLDKLERQLIDLAHKEPSKKDADPTALGRAHRRAASRARRLSSAIEQTGDEYVAHRLHAVRIAVKKLKYALEVVRDLGGSGVARPIASLKQAQDLLGRWRDLEVLIERVHSVRAGLGPPDRAVARELDAFGSRLETECRRLHQEYLASRHTIIGVIDQIRAARAGGLKPSRHVRSDHQEGDLHADRAVAAERVVREPERRSGSGASRRSGRAFALPKVVN